MKCSTPFFFKWYRPGGFLFLLLCSFLGSRTAYALDIVPESWPFRASLTGALDVEGYHSDGPPPGLLFSDDKVFLNPRMTFLLDLSLQDRWFASAQARIDRGFDPGSREEGQVRLDEYFIRWAPGGSGAFNMQAGKFATVFGNWVPRHLSWTNPFITAPAPYENVIGIGDRGTPLSREAFLARRNAPENKKGWMPLVWGPSYAHGVSIFGRSQEVEYAFEVKSEGLSSRPSSWEADEVAWDAPTMTARLGWRPNPTWSLGTSASTGAYLQSDPERTLPQGTEREDFRQRTLGLDFAYAHGHFELWAEVVLARFEVPRVGQASTAAWYVEGKYKLTPNLFVAARWNQQVFDDVASQRGPSPWERNLFRADFSVGYRITRNLQAKLQYSYGQEKGVQANSEHLVAGQVSLKLQ